VSAVLLWTRNPGALETISLVLSRIGQPFLPCGSAEAVTAAVRASDGPALLVLGPSFNEAEALAVRTALVERTGVSVLVVLLEDVLEPLPPRVFADDAVRLRIPVRPRTLREVVDAWRAAGP
jgi:hypothetical protein